MIATEIFNVLLLVAIALIFARVLGHIFDKFKQPAVIGELFAGVIIGIIVIMFFSGQEYFLFGRPLPAPNLNPYVLYEGMEYNPFDFLAEIGILFLLFISGLETRMSKLKKMEKASSFVAVGGVFVPLILGYIVAITFLDFSTMEGIVVGLILTATSVGVTVRTLLDLHVLNSDVGTTILGGAVIDDILAIVLLALFMGAESVTGAFMIGIRIAIFFFIFLLIGLKVIDRILSLGDKLHVPKAFLSISLSILLIYSFFAYEAGISGIIGAFVAGLIIGQSFRSKKISEDVKTLGYGLFIPLFFVAVGFKMVVEGASLDIDSLATIGLLSVVIIIIGIVGKIIGCGLGAFLAGMNRKESLQIGVGMIPRMELALIISSAAIAQGIISGTVAHQILIATVILTIVTTIIAPVLIKASFKND